MKNVILDTNILIDNCDLTKFNKVYIPITVIEELDKLKNKKENDVWFRAKEAIKSINNTDNIEIIFDSFEDFPEYLEKTNDNKIIYCATKVINSDPTCIFLSNDYNVQLKCKHLKIPCEEYNNHFSQNEVYKGYKELQGGTAFINNLFEEIDNGVNTYNFATNEYLILYNSDLDNITEHRFDGKKFIDLKLPSSKVIKGINSLQRCALDLLNNRDIPIKIVAGGFGSGKSILSVKTGLYHVAEKEYYKTLMFIRNPIVADGADIGFLPGDKSEKIYDFCRPFLQYVDSNKDQFYAENLIRNEKIKMDVVSFLKGVSIDDSFVIMDEAEDLNEKLLKLVGSRIGKNSCIVFTGDYNQCESKYKNNNGLLKLIQSTKGNELVGTIILEEDVRSSASKVFANL